MSDLQVNPLLDRITARMKADNAVQKLHARWSAKGERWLHRLGRFLDRPGFAFLYPLYDRLTLPLFDWLAERQRVFLRRYF